MAEYSYATPVVQLLPAEDAQFLTPAARQLNKGDLVAIGSNLQTSRTRALTVQDINSVKRAFANTAVTTQASLWDIDISCCCCTPCCCAAAVMEPVRQLA